MRLLQLENLPVSEAALPDKIRERFDSRPTKILFIEADENLDYGDVLHIMDVCRQNGVAEIGLLTENKPTGS